jgi:hypothetical protein
VISAAFTAPRSGQASIARVRHRLRALITDIGLMEIAIGVALALALVDLATAIGNTLVSFWNTPALGDAEAFGDTDEEGTRLALENLFSDPGFDLAGHRLDLSIVIAALIEVLLVLVLALWLWPRQKPDAT